MSEWLARTQKNQILGPFSLEEIRERVLNHTLQLQDEVCPSGGYWFFLHDQSEVQKHLGLSLAGAKDSLQEITDSASVLLAQEEKRGEAPLSHSKKDAEGEITTVVILPGVSAPAVPPLPENSAPRPVIEKGSRRLQLNQKRFQRWLKVWVAVGLGLVVLGALLKALLGSI
jgi:hypothetical protein